MGEINEPIPIPVNGWKRVEKLTSPEMSWGRVSFAHTSHFPACSHFFAALETVHLSIASNGY